MRNDKFFRYKFIYNYFFSFSLMDRLVRYNILKTMKRIDGRRLYHHCYL